MASVVSVILAGLVLIVLKRFAGPTASMGLVFRPETAYVRQAGRAMSAIWGFVRRVSMGYAWLLKTALASTGMRGMAVIYRSVTHPVCEARLLLLTTALVRLVGAVVSAISLSVNTAVGRPTATASSQGSASASPAGSPPT